MALRILFVGLGGFFGAILRFGVTGWVHSHTYTRFPLGTLVVNIAGSFLLGLLMALMDSYIIPAPFRSFLTIGLLGAFTTFSTFTYETMALMQTGSYEKAFLNIFLSLLLGLMAVFAGIYLGRQF